jgi:hypothetical protein
VSPMKKSPKKLKELKLNTGLSDEKEKRKSLAKRTKTEKNASNCQNR